MKPIHCLILLLSCFQNISVAQSNKDNTIIVHGFVSFNQLKEALFDQGYIPTNSDSSFITTNYKPVVDFGEVSIMIKKTDSTLTIKGLLNTKFGGIEFKGEPLENSGQKGSANRVGFETMNKVATSFGFPVTYLRIK